MLANGSASERTLAIYVLSLCMSYIVRLVLHPLRYEWPLFTKLITRKRKKMRLSERRREPLLWIPYFGAISSERGEYNKMHKQIEVQKKEIVEPKVAVDRGRQWSVRSSISWL